MLATAYHISNTRVTQATTQATKCPGSHSRFHLDEHQASGAERHRRPAGRVDDTGGADVDDLAGPVAEVLNNGARASASVPEYTRPSWAAQEWVAAAA
jgi:hypothetical protein